MKAVLVTPWKNAWVPLYKDAFEARGYDFMVGRAEETVWREWKPDIVLHGWAHAQSKPLIGARNVMFLRRYELYSGDAPQVEWANIDVLICVNSWIKSMIDEALKNNGFSAPTHLIYNAVNTERFKFKAREVGKKIGMACFINAKKNLPLAAQILAELPEGYELHIAGGLQDSPIAEYMNHIATATKRKIYFYEHVESQHMDKWWDMMNYCLCTSLTEGNPNNVIEAMAKGIKPIVHNWPGSLDQFGDYLFDTVPEAIAQIISPEYESETYRAHVERQFSLANIERVVDLCCEKELACVS